VQTGIQRVINKGALQRTDQMNLEALERRIDELV